ncbi:MAG TPA: response regulator [Longimicrobium sp.]|nr:response regulator [Longimicrobium sp.]
MTTRQPTLALADDDEAQVEMVSAWLERQGYRVHRFGSGDELLSWAAAEPLPVDAFLLDVDMPGRDGYQSCRELRTIPEYAATPAVFVTTAPPPEVEQNIAGLPPSWMVPKGPELFPRLRERLSGILDAA